MRKGGEEKKALALKRGMWLLLTEPGKRGLGLGMAGHSAWVATFLKLSVVLTCIRWYHPPLCPHLWAARIWKRA